jgi:hypothetical protein
MLPLALESADFVDTLMAPLASIPDAVTTEIFPLAVESLAPLFTKIEPPSSDDDVPADMMTDVAVN